MCKRHVFLVKSFECVPEKWKWDYHTSIHLKSTSIFLLSTLESTYIPESIRYGPCRFLSQEHVTCVTIGGGVFRDEAEISTIHNQWYLLASIKISEIYTNLYQHILFTERHASKYQNLPFVSRMETTERDILEREKVSKMVICFMLWKMFQCDM